MAEQMTGDKCTARQRGGARSKHKHGAANRNSEGGHGQRASAGREQGQRLRGLHHCLRTLNEAGLHRHGQSATGQPLNGRARTDCGLNGTNCGNTERALPRLRELSKEAQSTRRDT